MLRQLIFGLFLLLLTAQAMAQSYPARPIRIIIPLAPGGSADVGARMVGDRISQTLGQPVLIESRAGGGGTVGVAYVAKAAPDGYTLVVGPAGALSINVSLTKLPYDPVKDLAPVSGMTRSTLFIVTLPSSPIQSVKDLVAFAKANPGRLNFGTPGIATAQHLAGELLKTMTGIDMVHVPFKGSSEATTAVLGGQIQLGIIGPAGVAPQVKAGKIRVIAGTDSQRSLSLPDVPPVAEAVPNYEASGWLAFFAPAGTPPDIVSRLNTEMVRALRQPEVAERISSGGEQPHIVSPEELGRFVREEIEKWARVIKAAGIRLES